MPTKDRYQELLAKTKEEFPRFRVTRRKNSWLRPVFWILSKTLRRKFENFTTTIFSHMYVGEGWDDLSQNEKYQVLRHEKTHVHQFHYWPLGKRLWFLNHLAVAICYLAVLPVLWTFRAKFEREGYTQTMLVWYELYGPFSDISMEYWARRMATTFSSSTYAWMWTRTSAYAWAMETMRRINDGEIRNEKESF